MSLPLAKYVTFHPCTLERREGDVVLVFHENAHPSPVGAVPPEGCPSPDCILAVFVVPEAEMEDHIGMLRFVRASGKPAEMKGVIYTLQRGSTIDLITSGVDVALQVRVHEGTVRFTYNTANGIVDNLSLGAGSRWHDITCARMLAAGGPARFELAAKPA